MGLIDVTPETMTSHCFGGHTFCRRIRGGRGRGSTSGAHRMINAFHQMRFSLSLRPFNPSSPRRHVLAAVVMLPDANHVMNCALKVKVTGDLGALASFL